MSLILENLYLGSVKIAKDIKFIKEHNIKYILICAKGIQQYFSNKVEYKQLNISDNPCQIIIMLLPESIQFIHENIKKGAILVHCLGGKSRSASVVIAYVMFAMHASYEQAYQQVKTRHFEAQPNLGFVKQLKIFEKVLTFYGKQKQPQYQLMLQIMYDNNIESQVRQKLNSIKFKNNYEIEQDQDEEEHQVMFPQDYQEMKIN